MQNQPLRYDLRHDLIALVNASAAVVTQRERESLSDVGMVRRPEVVWIDDHGTKVRPRTRTYQELTSRDGVRVNVTSEPGGKNQKAGVAMPKMEPAD